MKNVGSTILMLVVMLACKGPGVASPVATSAPASTTSPVATTPAVRTLVWADEFDKPGLPDSTKWGYDVGGNGWGNKELEYYTNKRTENARIENGKLIIEARKEAYKGSNYTSARLLTKGIAEWKYGRVEAMAKLPKGVGTWPAIWMLGKKVATTGWPLGGEIDIMEHVGFDEGVVHGTVHTEAYNHVKGTQKGKQINVKNVTGDFHLYAIEWTADQIDFFVDDQKYYSVQKAVLGNTEPQWPFDQPFFLILNVAVGGGWGGQKGVDESIWPQRMEVDYVRVYQ
ncbi:glycoside hydrolase family 16 protein [Spirosoma luteum]|uniref:glycoside hydrolase family 16 protein n=1 Tax=Spirosoma luteum TaxID=431553 RepID=UPI00039A591B|nr:glycoside hydrolase family 16 protein [Spirosoma luteum]